MWVCFKSLLSVILLRGKLRLPLGPLMALFTEMLTLLISSCHFMHVIASTSRLHGFSFLTRDKQTLSSFSLLQHIILKASPSPRHRSQKLTSSRCLLAAEGHSLLTHTVSTPVTHPHFPYTHTWQGKVNLFNYYLTEPARACDELRSDVRTTNRSPLQRVGGGGVGRFLKIEIREDDVFFFIQTDTIGVTQQRV